MFILPPVKLLLLTGKWGNNESKTSWNCIAVEDKHRQRKYIVWKKILRRLSFALACSYGTLSCSSYHLSKIIMEIGLKPSNYSKWQIIESVFWGSNINSATHSQSKPILLSIFHEKNKRLVLKTQPTSITVWMQPLFFKFGFLPSCLSSEGCLVVKWEEVKNLISLPQLFYFTLVGKAES